MITGKKGTLGGLVVTLLSTTAALPAVAQETGASSARFEEIVVTATRRSESLQDVPLSLSVFDASAIAKANVLEFDSLSSRVPGLAMQANGQGQNRYYIRGIGQIAVNQSPTTGVYFDETPLQVRVTTGYFQPEPLMHDLERVEILRGPQGTLFGASAMGGSIRFISKKPDTNNFEGSVSGTISTTKDGGENYTLKGVANIPVVQDKFALRIVALHDDQSGWIDDLRPLTSNVFENINNPAAIIKDVNTTKTDGVRIMGLFTPDETLRITPTIYYQKTKAGVNKPQTDEIFGADARLRARWINEYLKNELFTGNLLIEKDVDILGGVTFLSSTSRLDATLDRLADLTPYAQSQFSVNRTQVGFYSYQEIKQWTQDFRVVSNNENPFQYVFGLYYNRTTTPTTVTNKVINDWGGGLNPIQRLREFGFTQKEWAAYGELSYLIGDFKLAAGGRYFRYSQEDSRFQSRPSGVDYDFTERGKEDGFSPRAVLSYMPTDTQNYYVSYSQGFRTGGVNAPITEDACPAAVREALGIPEVPPPFKSDKTKNYEIGAKVQLDDRVTFNAAAYRIDWVNYQQNVTRECGGNASFGFTGNAGKVKSKGFEAELAVYPIDNLKLNGGVALVNAKFGSAVPSLGIVAGERLWDIPKWSYNAGAEFAFDITSSLMGALRADANYVGSSKSGLATVSPPPTRASYTMVNLSADIAADAWVFTVFVNNLTDISPNYGLDFIHGDIPISTPFSRLTVRPRTIGATFSTNF